MSNKANRFEINTPKQLAAYIDNYYICNMCREARWEKHPTLFKTVSPVFRPKEFYNEHARNKIEELPVKCASSYCRTCSAGRTIKRNYKKPGQDLPIGVPDECIVKYKALILDWEKTTKIKYGYNVLEKNDGVKSCKIDIPTELALDVHKHQELIDKIKLLENDNLKLSNELTETQETCDNLSQQNHILNGKIADLSSDLEDMDANKQELPEMSKTHIQDIYDRIFKHRSRRSFGSGFWQLKQENFIPLLAALSSLGAKVSSNLNPLLSSKNGVK